MLYTLNLKDALVLEFLTSSHRATMYKTAYHDILHHKKYLRLNRTSALLLVVANEDGIMNFKNDCSQLNITPITTNLTSILLNSVQLLLNNFYTSGDFIQLP